MGFSLQPFPGTGALVPGTGSPAVGEGTGRRPRSFLSRDRAPWPAGLGWNRMSPTGATRSRESLRAAWAVPSSPSIPAVRGMQSWNHWVGKDLEIMKPNCTCPLLIHTPKRFIFLAFIPLQGWKLHHLPGQPLPMLRNLLVKKSFLMSSLKLPEAVGQEGAGRSPGISRGFPTPALRFLGCTMSFIPAAALPPSQTPGQAVGWSGARDCSQRSTQPWEGERAAIKITPGPAPAHCGFLRFTALPGGKKRQEPAWLRALTLSSPVEKVLEGTFSPLSPLPASGPGQDPGQGDHHGLLSCTQRLGVGVEEEAVGVDAVSLSCS
ncbi:serine/threonine-protein kinase PDIK1L isoform X2 [Cuculus canorus]|uniref:serine/threonine-protein kinase PDIK1L isoform X2 n=1 Tax=Cuculus canorus TaxID=55661 RepID=UPI0023AA4895|nr:serine/threonine-protein kinase PDIK1L isoform X2 [Cuculus canorus]